MIWGEQAFVEVADSGRQPAGAHGASKPSITDNM